MTKFLKRWLAGFKYRRFAKWALAFSKKHDLPYKGILMLAGYRK